MSISLTAQNWKIVSLGMSILTQLLDKKSIEY